jgi:GNAT superfamily N-acetyltransferase
MVWPDHRRRGIASALYRLIEADLGRPHDLGRQLAEHANQPREAPVEAVAVAAVEFYLVAQLVDLDAEAVEFDLVLPIVQE